MSFAKSSSIEKKALDKIINKSRAHMYKPTQIAEILYRDRVHRDIKLDVLETYRNLSKKWRNLISKKLVGRVCTSSAKYQDNVFEDNAVPPKILSKLGKTNRSEEGSVEKYIYGRFKNKFSNMNSALKYCSDKPIKEFELSKFLDLFRLSTELKRSVDKIYEIVVYALFSTLVKVMGIEIKIKIKDFQNPIFKEFEDFSEKILGLNLLTLRKNSPAKLFRAGVTNAADKGLDIWGNFGVAIQIKYLSLTEELAEEVVDSISSDRIIIVCDDAEEKIILSLLNQLGWRAKIQSIITFKELDEWYEKALRGRYSDRIGMKVISSLERQIKLEFPSTNKAVLDDFFVDRDYKI